MARKGRIHFRCWYCNRKLAAGWDQVGERRVCNCGQRYRVPRRDGISKRDKTLLDWFLEFTIYGFGAGFLAGLLGLIIFRFTALGLSVGSSRLLVVAVPATIGFLAGGLFGERGVNWIGSLVRNVVEDERD
jgi:hypothetical protein